MFQYILHFQKRKEFTNFDVKGVESGQWPEALGQASTGAGQPQGPLQESSYLPWGPG